MMISRCWQLNITTRLSFTTQRGSLLLITPTYATDLRGRQYSQHLASLRHSSIRFRLRTPQLIKMLSVRSRETYLKKWKLVWTIVGVLFARKNYRTESRFSFLSHFLIGRDFDRSDQLWRRFQDARDLRDQWTHPKPPFDTCSLVLPDVYSAITAVHDMFITLSGMMNLDPPLWLRPIDEILDQLNQPSENMG
jgi:hypothetical protein